ncbi:hypothetical protein [Demequina activiva]|uniref:Coenzyme PQQ synthesis protein D (PqqD) n=1 Tax=Demequina activiva TaxID=1582364 RepID=A0A919Q2P0_9MICO|nr:hypothetical protein [Demequina activiva]GIG53766.1 hypothetical protein Dac01nite_05180 [Demequina activiva]
MSLPGFPDPVDAKDTDRVIAHVDSVLERDGEMLVLRGSDLTLLSPLASALVATVRAREYSVGQLAARLSAQFGRPEGMDPGVAVRQVLGALQERGLIEVRPPRERPK